MEPFATATRLVPNGQATLSVPDCACTQCHPKLEHNSPPSLGSCSSCHKEHRGDILLTRPGDRHCTDCHAKLDSPSERKVSSFAAHPEFAVWRAKEAVDPGNVEFNHALHLGLREEDSRAINKPAVHDLQKMQCAYCHQEQTAGGGRWELESGKWPVGRGNFMKPIQFDQHCQQCHPLLLPLKTEKVPAPLKASVEAFLRMPIMHPAKGQSAWNVRAAARERYLKFAQDNGAVLKLPRVALDQWQVLPGLPRRGEPVTQGQWDWANERWQEGEKLLFDTKAGCAHCHAEAAKKVRGPDGLPDFGSPKIPRRWFEHASFDHQAHGFLDCNACHTKAATSDNRKDVLIPKLASCQACHQERSGFAKADCLECHQFHHREGSEAWQGKLRIEDFPH